MSVRVITATRGGSEHLEAAVASVAVVGGSRHILVCPVAVRADLARKFPALTVLAEGGGGLYAALNTGLDAPGDEEFVTWINDDDLLMASGVAVALQRFAADASLGAAYGRVTLVDANNARLGELPVARHAPDLLPLIAAGVMPLAQPGTIFRRGTTAKVGRFDPSFRLAGDLDFLVRALRAGVPFAFVDVEVARFRLHVAQLSKDEAAAANEHARVVGALPRASAFAARWRFRWQNLPAYFERIRRHGFVSMKSLYRHG